LVKVCEEAQYRSDPFFSKQARKVQELKNKGINLHHGCENGAYLSDIKAVKILKNGRYRSGEKNKIRRYKSMRKISRTCSIMQYIIPQANPIQI